jgi:stearoyl-CoA desaturase (delta-9 desaturase)
MTSAAHPSLAYGVEPPEPQWALLVRFAERHIGLLLAIAFVPLNKALVCLALASFAVRMFGIEGINHRYFSHRAYKAGRVMQFVLALIAAQAGQRGSLWWAAQHRDHHKYAETSRDPHSPVINPFFEAYAGWYRNPRFGVCNLDDIPDFARYPELRWLNRYFWVPYYGGGVLLFLVCHYGLLGPDITGIGGLLWGFYVPGCLVLHAVALINTLCHMPQLPGGYRRYDVADRSVNRVSLALFTLGAGFHNNHHRYAAAARAGFAWYEIDLSYYVLRLMQALRLIRDVKSRIPDDILVEGGIKPRISPS